MPRRQRYELVALAGEERIRTYNERADMRLVEGSESGIDLAFGAGVQDPEGCTFRRMCRGVALARKYIKPHG